MPRAASAKQSTRARPAKARAARQAPAAWGYADHKEEILRRLSRVEGQVRGLHRMVEDDAYCIDVLTQISAASKALRSVAIELVDDHLGHCVAEALAAGGPGAQDKVAEASAAVARLMRS